MLARRLSLLPPALVPLAAAWVVAARGISPPPAVAVTTVTLAAALLLGARGNPRILSGPHAWLAALVGWSAVAAALRPVALHDAAASVATGLVALALASVARLPRVAAWGRIAVVAAGSASGAWLMAERLLFAGRPPGPFGNPNPAATIAVLALALVPRLCASWVPRVIAFACTAGGVVASGSRAALVGLGAVAIVWAMTASIGGRVRLGAAVLVTVAAFGLAGRLMTDFDPLRYERFRIWGVALRVAQAEFPIGCGPGGYADAAAAHNFPLEREFARFARIPDLAESDVLQAVATLGVPGLALLVGLSFSVVRELRRSDRRGWGVAAALLATSAFNSQLFVPAVAWMAALSLGCVLPRAHGRRREGSRAAHAAFLTAVAIIVGSVLALPRWGAGEPPDEVLDRAEARLHRSPSDDRALADAEAGAWLGCAARPMNSRGWRILASVRLARARARGDAQLARGAAWAFAQARRVNPLDAFAAFGEAQALRLAGDVAGAWSALRTAVNLEPNFVGAWLEQAGLHLAAGQLGPAREALRRAEAARALGAGFSSGYQGVLAWADPQTISRLRSATGEVR